jgi:hypothetical protein
VADNAFFNDAVARWLGLPRLRCVPHSLQLTWVEVTRPFDLFVACTSGVSALLGAGGGTSRKDAVRNAGLVPERLHCVPTRWGQTERVGRYLLEDDNFDKLRVLINDEPAFFGRGRGGKKAAAPAAAAAELERADEALDGQQEVQMGPGGARVKVASVVQLCRRAFEAGVPDEARTKEAYFQLHLVNAIAPGLNQAIKVFSGNISTIEYPAATALLEEVGRRLEDAASLGNQDSVIELALSNAKLVLSPATRATVSYSLLLF